MEFCVRAPNTSLQPGGGCSPQLHLPEILRERLGRAIGFATEPRVEKPCRTVVVPNDPLLPLLRVRGDLHVLEAAPAAVSVLSPRALYLRSSAVTYGPPELRLGHG